MADNGKSEQIVKMKVTPQKAKEWLENANHGNRHLSAPHVERLARDMSDGAWGHTPEPISFDKTGRLIDGQHRLAAVVLSGVSIVFWVALNCDSEAQKYLDAGRRRSLVDAYGFYMGEALSKRAESITKAMMDSTCGYGYTRRQEAEFYEKHKDAILFAVKASAGSIPMQSGKNRRIPAAVGAIIGRAFYTRDQQQIERFCDIIRTGISSGKQDCAAISMRDALTQEASSHGDPQGRRWLYRRGEYLLERFLQRARSVSRREVANKELYPIPGEDGYTKLAIAS